MYNDGSTLTTNSNIHLKFCGYASLLKTPGEDVTNANTPVTTTVNSKFSAKTRKTQEAKNGIEGKKNMSKLKQ